MKISLFLLTLTAARVWGQGDTLHDLDQQFTGSAFTFTCPEPNGLFADPEQCDLYYVCEDGVSVPSLCEDGLLFDDSQRNREKCVLPHNVDCGSREFVQV